MRSLRSCGYVLLACSSRAIIIIISPSKLIKKYQLEIVIIQVAFLGTYLYKLYSA